VPIIAFVTCRNIPEPDLDESLLLDACRKAGIDCELVPWEDTGIDWSRYDMVVLRSSWNYFERETEFRAWIDSTSKNANVWNGRKLLLDNLDKHYLADLDLLGIPIVPTRFVSSANELSSMVISETWDSFVVKPTISAGSFMTRKFSVDELPQASCFLGEILQSRGAMVQKFMGRVADGGEVALIHIDGVLTHGVVKHPRFVGQDESVSEAFVPTPEQSVAARRVMNTVREPWLYARVDLMQSDEGQWLLSELELIEPSLFFLQHQPALDRFVEALKRLAG